MPAFFTFRAAVGPASRLAAAFLFFLSFRSFPLLFVLFFITIHSVGLGCSSLVPFSLGVRRVCSVSGFCRSSGCAFCSFCGSCCGRAAVAGCCLSLGLPVGRVVLRCAAFRPRSWRLCGFGGLSVLLVWLPLCPVCWPSSSAALPWCGRSPCRSGRSSRRGFGACVRVLRACFRSGWRFVVAVRLAVCGAPCLCCFGGVAACSCSSCSSCSRLASPCLCGLVCPWLAVPCLPCCAAVCGALCPFWRGCCWVLRLAVCCAACGFLGCRCCPCFCGCFCGLRLRRGSGRPPPFPFGLCVPGGQLLRCRLGCSFGCFRFRACWAVCARAAVVSGWRVSCWCAALLVFFGLLLRRWLWLLGFAGLCCWLGCAVVLLAAVWRVCSGVAALCRWWLVGWCSPGLFPSGQPVLAASRRAAAPPRRFAAGFFFFSVCNDFLYTGCKS